MKHFIEWLGCDYKVKSIESKTIAGTMSVYIINMECGKTLVSADRALVSYDRGFYLSYKKRDEIDLLIEGIIESYQNAIV